MPNCLVQRGSKCLTAWSNEEAPAFFFSGANRAIRLYTRIIHQNFILCQGRLELYCNVNLFVWTSSYLYWHANGAATGGPRARAPSFGARGASRGSGKPSAPAGRGSDRSPNQKENEMSKRGIDNVVTQAHLMRVQP